MTEQEAMSAAFVDTASKGWSTLEHGSFEAGWQAALDFAKSGQEPVGYWGGEFSKDGGAELYEVPQVPLFGCRYKNVPVYTHPAPAQPVRLSEEEIEAVWSPLHDAICFDHKVFANAIQDAMLAKAKGGV